MSPTPHGRPGAAATAACCAIQSAVAVPPAPTIPSPPAADTAAASCPDPTPAMGAPTTGTSSPKVSVSQVLSMCRLLASGCRASILARWCADHEPGEARPVSDAERAGPPVITETLDAYNVRFCDEPLRGHARADVSVAARPGQPTRERAATAYAASPRTLLHRQHT